MKKLFIVLLFLVSCNKQPNNNVVCYDCIIYGLANTGMGSFYWIPSSKDTTICGSDDAYIFNNTNKAHIVRCQRKN